ncbi:hypothetical protein SAMN04489761_0855 [Tenacibaculum sp. MAR_2009_124]|nr:hypothetical protein [Tenacibaculum sp. MAR_2009_124]SEB46147.1 hypothetical protein SAMN04489761_0855 [Tenacibaculum sp. MAR_2009_124]
MPPLKIFWFQNQLKNIEIKVLTYDEDHANSLMTRDGIDFGKFNISKTL